MKLFYYNTDKMLCYVEICNIWWIDSDLKRDNVAYRNENSYVDVGFTTTCGESGVLSNIDPEEFNKEIKSLLECKNDCIILTERKIPRDENGKVIPKEV